MEKRPSIKDIFDQEVDHSFHEPDNNITLDNDSLHNVIHVTPIEVNDRTLYGGYRVNLAAEARELAAHVDQERIRIKKPSYRRNWEDLFGKHSTTTGCTPQSLIDLFRKEGRVTMFLCLLGISGK